MRNYRSVSHPGAIGHRMTESSLVEAILQTLNFMEKTFAFRMETNGSVRRNDDGSYRMVSNKGGRGKPDICFSSHGFCGFLEVKMPDAHAEPHQKRWMENAVERGRAYCAVVHSMEEAEGAVHELWKEKRIAI